MIVEVYFTPYELTPGDTAGKTVAVIDILRASTVTAIALQNGAKEIYPVDTLEHTAQAADRLAWKKPLLCGEREGKIIPGYDLGNSPLEFTPENIAGRTLIHCSTNGTVAMAASEAAAVRLMVGLVNARISAEEIARAGHDLVIICGGRDGTFSIEDSYGAGGLIALLNGYFSKVELGNDHAGTAEYIFEKNQDDPLDLIQDSPHGRYLADLGFEDDLAICAGVDTVPVLAKMDGEFFPGLPVKKP